MGGRHGPQGERQRDGLAPDGNQNAYRKVWGRYRARLRTRALPGDRFLNGGTYFLNRSRWPQALVAHATHVSGLRQKVDLLQRGAIWRCPEAAQWLRVPEQLCPRFA